MKSVKIGILLSLLFFVSTSNFSVVANDTVGVEKGDWVKYNVSSINPLEGGVLAVWERVEILDVSGTNLTIRVTRHISDEEEEIHDFSGDVTKNSIDLWVIPANLTYGDSFNAPGIGTMTIDDETQKTYAGANRTIVHASIVIGNIAYSPETTYSIFWDKQTGIAVEVLFINRVPDVGYNMYVTHKATETNIWQAESNPTILYVSAAAAVTAIAVGATVLVIRRKKPPVTSASTKVQPPPSQK